MNDARTIISGKLDFLESVHEMSNLEYKEECFSSRRANLKVPKVVINSVRNAMESLPAFTNQFGDWPKISPGRNQELFVSYFNPKKEDEEVKLTFSEYNGKVFIDILVSVPEFEQVNEFLPEEQVDLLEFEGQILHLKNLDL